MNEELKSRQKAISDIAGFPVIHTPAGDRWRCRLQRPDGTFSPRAQDPQEERRFWKTRMEKGAPEPDAYAALVYERLEALALEAGVKTVLEVGPGWGNYTLPLCRHFSQVTCVDISPDNLSYLAQQAEKEGRPLETICSEWETAQVSKRDLVFAYNCFYRMPEPEWFLAKIDRSAQKLCVIGMNCPPELPWLLDLKTAGFPVYYTSQGCEELRDVLHSLGISPHMIDIPNQRIYSWQDEQALARRTTGFLTKPVPWDLLRPLVLPYCVQEADGSLACQYTFRSQLLCWKPT